MYSTCLFCNGSLGANTVIEVFPVGRRLAFDPAKGRLWVICRKCERWNLSPLEERWEAIEECERQFRDTRLRTSTANIGFARLKEGLELVRIGTPQRPEFSAWRYGDQFGRRRRNKIIRIGAATTAIGGVAAGLITAGVAAGASFGGGGWLIMRGVEAAYRRLVNGSPNEVVARLPMPDATLLLIRRRDLDKVGLVRPRGGDGSPEEWELSVAGSPVISRIDDLYYTLSDLDPVELVHHRLTGESAARVAGAILPALNWGGANVEEVNAATTIVEEAGGSAQRLFEKAAATHWSSSLLKLGTPLRLALEMAAHEDSERRALEGELAVLEAAWKEAEEIAGIADDLLLPPEITERIRKARPE